MTLATLAKRDMDGLEGEQHVVLGGRIMGWIFGPEWRDFTLCHSRHWAKRVGKRYSKLCLADKLAFVLTPAWLYLPMARLSGELQEYMRVASSRQLCGNITDFELSLLDSRNPRVWLEGLQAYTRGLRESRRLNSKSVHVAVQLATTHSHILVKLATPAGHGKVRPWRRQNECQLISQTEFRVSLANSLRPMPRMAKGELAPL